MLTKYATIGSLLLMNKSTNNLSNVLDELTQAARARGLNDSDWAARAGLRKETLSRLRRRQSCGFTTLLALANAVDMRLSAVSDALPALSPDGHFPDGLDREYEERLLKLCASCSLSPQRWSTLGPGFFMAGLAVMIANALTDLTAQACWTWLNVCIPAPAIIPCSHAGLSAARCGPPDFCPCWIGK